MRSLHSPRYGAGGGYYWRTMATSASPEVTAYVRDWIDRSRKSGKTWAVIAEELGVSTAQVSNIWDESRGVGPKLEQTFAEKHHQGSIDELRRAAAVFYRKHYEHARDVYPNRSRALVRLKGLLSCEVEERVRSLRYRTDDDPSELHWIEVAVEEQSVCNRAQFCIKDEPTDTQRAPGQPPRTR